MPFYWSENGVTIHGGIDIIPDQYKDQARRHRDNVIRYTPIGCCVPPVIVAIGKTLDYVMGQELIPYFNQVLGEVV